MLKKLLQGLILSLAVGFVGLPAQAGMIGTAQIQGDAVSLSGAAVDAQRDWITEQLVVGGVAEDQARLRVAAMTDVQVAELHRRIDEAPAGGVDGLVIIILVLVFTEIMGYTDIIPD